MGVTDTGVWPHYGTQWKSILHKTWHIWGKQDKGGQREESRLFGEEQAWENRVGVKISQLYVNGELVTTFAWACPTYA